MKLKRILESKDALVELNNKELPIKTSYQITKITKKVQEELENFQEQKQNLIDKYKDDDGNISEESEKKIVKQLEDLLDVEVDIEINLINVNELEDINIKPGHLMGLDPFLES